MRSDDLALALARLPAAMAPTLDRIRRDRAAALPAIHPAFDLLLEHLCATDLGVSKLLKAEDVTASRFAERFHAATGMNPSAYIKALRIEVGCRLLETPEISVLTIGEVLGWERRGSFSEAFHGVMGMLPTAFRKLQIAYNRRRTSAAPDALRTAVRTSEDCARPGIETMIQVAMGTAETAQLSSALAVLDRELTFRLGRRIGERGQRLRNQTFARGVWRLASELDASDAERFLAVSGMLVPEVFELLFEKTRTEGREDRRRGVRVARMALAAIDRVPASSWPAPALAELRIRAFTWLGNAHRLACDFQAAESAFSAGGAVLAMLGEAQAPIGRAEYLDRKAALRWLQGRFDEAYELATQAAQLRDACSPEQGIRMAMQMAAIQAAKGDLRASCDTLAELSTQLTSVADAYLATAVWVNLAFRHLELHEPEPAEQAIEQAKKRACQAFRPDLQRAGGLLAKSRHEHRRALNDLEQASQGFGLRGDLYFAAVSAREAALVAAETGEALDTDTGRCQRATEETTMNP